MSNAPYSKKINKKDISDKFTNRNEEKKLIN